MRTMLKTIAGAVALSTGLVAAAGADLVAGWDFSQYQVDGSLTTGTGAVDPNNLPSNYSSQDPTSGSGAESAAFGTAIIGVGSGVVPVSTPASGSLSFSGPGFTPGQALTVNNPPQTFMGLAPVLGIGDDAFNSYANLVDEGPQVVASPLGLTATAATSIDFEVDADPDNSGVENWGAWTLSFAGRVVEPGGTATVPISWGAPGCGGFAQVGEAKLTDTEKAFVVYLSGLSITETGCVRLGLNPANGQPVIDNVAITATLPEPGSVAMFGAGALCLLGLARRRTKRG